MLLAAGVALLVASIVAHRVAQRADDGRAIGNFVFTEGICAFFATAVWATGFTPTIGQECGLGAASILNLYFALAFWRSSRPGHHRAGSINEFGVALGLLVLVAAVLGRLAVGARWS
jgi:hypothetical protein